MTKIIKILLILIILLASILRLYRLESIPPSLSWDEAAVGYNAFTIANFGRDEHGKVFPLTFKSFGDDKHPIHVYFTALSVKILGLNEFSTRLPSAVFGIFNVLLIFFLARIIFKNDWIGLIAAFSLAISPYNIHFSRFNHEANFMLFFFMLGLFSFFLSIKKERNFLFLATLSFAICFITYHPAKVVVPITIVTLSILYFKNFKKNDVNLIASLAILSVFFVLLTFNPQLLGTARVSQTLLKKELIEKTQFFKITKNEEIGKMNLILNQYFWHFSPEFLFIKGDKNPRLSSYLGEFYKVDAVFIILGLLFLLQKRTKEGFVLLLWALSSPLPSSLVTGAPHAARASFMMGSFSIISALGFYSFVGFFKKDAVKWMIGIIILILYMLSLYSYLTYYYNEYTKRYAIEWQYGMKQIIEFVKANPHYEQVFMTDARSQPYIFFLYYLKLPLADYLNTVFYNNSDSKSYNTVSIFEHYYFEGWDPLEIFPNSKMLYIITPSQYDGLRYKLSFEIKKIIYYPNEVAAFYIISAKQ